MYSLFLICINTLNRIIPITAIIPPTSINLILTFSFPFFILLPPIFFTICLIFILKVFFFKIHGNYYYCCIPLTLLQSIFNLNSKSRHTFRYTYFTLFCLCILISLGKNTRVCVCVCVCVYSTKRFSCLHIYIPSSFIIFIYIYINYIAFNCKW